MTSAAQKYTRHSTLTLEEGLTAIAEGLGKPKNFKVTLNGQRVKCTSLRLQTFYHKGVVCALCGMKATHFALETNQPLQDGVAPYHINLWGRDADGEEVLFTHDHILARSLGGTDALDNTQTSCSPCNKAKSYVENAELAKRHAERKQGI